MHNDPEAGAKYDAFISHASEDKKSFVRPLAQALASLGASVWYDEFTMRIGDSLSQSIDRGLSQSRFGIVVLSPSFLSKPWPQHELRGLVTREIDSHSAILPIWHGVTRADVAKFSPTLADKLAVSTSEVDAIDIALQILNVIRPDLYAKHPRSQLVKLANGEALAELQNELSSLREQLSEYQCPHCGSLLVSSVDAPFDEREKHWDAVRTFECGYVEHGCTTLQLCPHDPQFPKLEDFELRCDEAGAGFATSWVCMAFPKTDAARKLRLYQTFGRTREEAESEMKQQYERLPKRRS
jgi:hypothetical protein